MKTFIAALFALLLSFALTAHAVENKQFQIQPADDAWRAALPHDAEKATQAYMDRLPKATVDRAERLLRRRLLAAPVEFPHQFPITLVMLGGPSLGAVPRLGASRRQAALHRGCDLRPAFWLAELGAGSAADDLPGLLSRAPVRHGHAGLRRLVRRATGRACGARWSSPHRRAVLYRAIRYFGERWWLAGAIFAIVLQYRAVGHAGAGSTRCSTPTSR